jgi:hypothetical protein
VFLFQNSSSSFLEREGIPGVPQLGSTTTQQIKPSTHRDQILLTLQFGLKQLHFPKLGRVLRNAQFNLVTNEITPTRDTIHINHPPQFYIPTPIEWRSLSTLANPLFTLLRNKRKSRQIPTFPFPSLHCCLFLQHCRPTGPKNGRHRLPPTTAAAG